MWCSLPPPASTPLMQLCLKALRSVLEDEVFQEAVFDLYKKKVEHAEDTLEEEWRLFRSWLLACLGIRALEVQYSLINQPFNICYFMFSLRLVALMSHVGHMTWSSLFQLLLFFKVVMKTF